MHYLGGKARLGKKIASALSQFKNNHNIFLEPFCGALNVTIHINGMQRKLSDIHCDLIELYKALQNGWIPPDKVSERLYNDLKNDFPSALRAFVGFVCSFGGKYFGGYARDPKSDRNYALNAKNSLLKKLNYIKDVEFTCIDYKLLKPDNCLIYCDPPYRNTTKYNGTIGFDSDEFWDIMRIWSKNNTVIISEYQAPYDFDIIAEFETKTDLGDKNNNKIYRIERLFKLRKL